MEVQSHGGSYAMHGQQSQDGGDDQAWLSFLLALFILICVYQAFESFAACPVQSKRHQRGAMPQ